jgi:hypothetical protein
MKRPSVAEQVRKTGAPENSALAKLIRENQDFELLHPEELADAYPIPLWLRVAWRKQHPEIPMPAKNPGAAYPEILSQILKRMVANPHQAWGPNAKPATPGSPAAPAEPGAKPPAPAKKKSTPRRKA